MRKVRGEVNPADIFTKHLPSREKVHQLMGLFGCEYREGRAKAAPLLRPHDVDGREGGHPDVDPLPTFAMTAEGEIHDLTRLPHMHSEAEKTRFFPLIESAPEVGNTRDWVPGEDVEVENEMIRKPVPERSLCVNRHVK